ncbi:hypothetical protein DICVIV_07612 [Dictyocaulus viviparus]|uniref:Uncharacterized protein n=1 Tax=Dictyocaulus viviparus TaxID=29172 RepID=A0A0D8XRB3_DICVI|nr:hypothetical protein DICVIV_07612 [Dictyocaulus viviparus]
MCIFAVLFRNSRAPSAVGDPSMVAAPSASVPAPSVPFASSSASIPAPSVPVAATQMLTWSPLMISQSIQPTSHYTTTYWLSHTNDDELMNGPLPPQYMAMVQSSPMYGSEESQRNYQFQQSFPSKRIS